MLQWKGWFQQRTQQFTHVREENIDYTAARQVGKKQPPLITSLFSPPPH